MTRFIAPGSTVGIIGGGIAGYQLARAASKVGMRVAVLAKDITDIALAVADVAIAGTVRDKDAFARFRSQVDVVTYVDETVADAETLQAAFGADVLPSGTDILGVTQDRYLEKVFLEDLNMNVLPYGQVITSDDIDEAVVDVGFPSILKPIQKGIGVDQQLLLETDVDIWRAKSLLQKRPYILEAWLDQPRELGVVCVKSAAGLQVLPVVENDKVRHRLRASIVPAQLDSSVVVEILRVAEEIGSKIEYTGVFAVEFFLTEAGALYVKRVSPGPRPGGDVLRTVTGRSQYALHMRAILGWPVPTVPVNGAAVLIPLTNDDRDAVTTQIQIKPTWRWQFFPGGGPVVGQVTIPGPLTQAFSAIIATGSFDIKSTGTLDNGGDKQ